MRIFLVFLITILFQSPVYARHNSDHPLSEEEWKEIMEKVTLMDDSAFMPSLLPIIMSNRDALQLSDAQITKFRQWRKDNYVDMVNIMNEIIEKKVQFSVESISTQISNEHLLAFQADIHHLQRELLQIRLSCRDILMQTLSEEQWESFGFIVADYPRVASFFSQAQTVEQHTGHEMR